VLPATREPGLRPLGETERELATAVRRRVDPARLRADVERLPSPRNHTHLPDAMGRALDIISGVFDASGWIVERRPYELRDVEGFLDYVDEAAAPRAVRTTYGRLSGVNLVAVKPGVTTDAVVVGAHYDTVRDSPGANDNSASVAVLMELARVLAPCRFRDTVLLVAFDMEELGLLGSRVFVSEARTRHAIKGAVVYETMGYVDHTPDSQTVLARLDLLYPGQVRRIRNRGLAGDWTAVLYRRSAQELARAFAEGLAFAAGPDVPVLWRDPLDVPLLGRMLRAAMPALRNLSRSDHVSFWDAGLPAIMVSDTANLRYPHYHQPTDTAEKLDYERLAAIGVATAVALARTAGIEWPGEWR
jgi:hypothetical protein